MTNRFISAISRNITIVGMLYLLSLTNAVQAQTFAADEIEVNRDANELSDLLAGFKPLPNPEVAPLLDTAMVFTSIHPTEIWVHCTAKDNAGLVEGRVRVRLPAGGVRFFLGSDITDERGFVGSVLCTGEGWIVGTEVMLGVVTSDIDVQQDTRADISSMLFPVTAVK